MKNKHLGKKTLSVFLAALMLMTTWVFFPGMVTFEASAASTVTGNYNESLVNGIILNNNVTTITDLNWAYNGDNQENEPNVYKNILYSSDCNVATANTGSVKLKDSGAATIQWYHGATTFLYDGVTTPQTGVMVACLPKGSSYNVRTYSSYIVSGNGLSLPHMWYASDGRANFMWVISAPGNTVAATNDGSVNGSNAWTVNSNTWLANKLQFTGALGTNEYYRDITVTWGWKGNQKSQGTGSVYTYEATSGNHIYVINWKVLKDAYAKAQEYIDDVKENPDRYSTASVKNLKSICDALIAAHPNNYVNVSKNDPSGYSSAASNAISRLNNFSFSDKTVDVTFENLFSINDWYNSESFSYDSSKGEVAVEDNNRIKITKTITGSELTTGSSYPGDHSENRYSMPVTGGEKYTVSFNTTSSVGSGTIAPEIFLFWYDVNNNPVTNTDGSATFNNKAFSGNGDHRVTFTAPETATKAEIRFDNDCTAQGSTLRFNNIAVYPADRAAEIELETWGSRPYTKAYAYNAALGTSLTVPTRPGYAFNGWYLDKDGDGVKDTGEEITNGSGTVVTTDLQNFGIDNHYNLYSDWVPAEYTLTFDGNSGAASDSSIAYNITGTVTMPNATRDGYSFDSWKVTTADGNWGADETYNVNDRVTGKYGNATLTAQWTKLWTVTFLNGDGSVLGTASVRNGEAAAAPQATPTKAADANGSYTFSSWDKTFSNVTEDITVTPQFTSNAHTVTYDFVSGRTCTVNAIVDKKCSGCNYYFFQGQPYDGTTETAWIALGHDFEGQAAVTGTSNGETGTHEVRCKYYYTESCGGTTRANHSFDSIISTEGADCVTPGTVTKKCACGETTQVEGEIDSNTHNDTRLINVKAATCLEDGYTGDTYCDDCKKTVKEGKVDPKLGHSFTNYVYNNDAECEIDGTETADCDRCDATDTRKKTGSALEHNWTDTEKYLKSAANCTDDEVYYKECSLCGISSESKTGETWTKAGTKWNHKFDGAYVTNNDGTHVQKCTNTDCTATGNKKNCTYGAWSTDNAVTHSHTCTACGYTPDAENHDWNAWESTDKAGTTAGEQTRSCKVCGRTETKDCTYKSEHKDATCTTPETTTYTCTDCGHGYTEIGDAATGHEFTGDYQYDADTDTHQQLCANGCGTYGVGVTAGETESCSWNYANKESGKHTATCVCGNSEEQNCSGGTATCTAEAECQFCGEAYGTTVPHSFTGAAVKLDGDVHAYLCEFCGTTTGIYGIGNVENDTEACSGGDATCSALAVCDTCKDTYGELDADDHKWITPPVADADNAGKHIYTCEYDEGHKKSGDCVSGSSVIVAPKCEEQGYTIQTCKECSYEWNTDYTDATDHNWVDPVCNNDGTHTLTCNNENADGWVCDETLTLNCAESAITFGLDPATCTEQGYTKYQCTVCNYTWNADFVPATGHSYSKKLRSLDEAYKRSEKTCTEAETYWYRCDNCTVSAGTEADKYADDLASIYWSNGSAAGHKMEKLVDETDLSKNRKSEADCNNPAVYYYSCSVCGEKDTTQTFTYKAALGHDYQNIVDEDDLTKNRVSEATCTSPAIYNKSCSRCGDVSAETFENGDKIGHKMTKTDAVKETCTTDGNVEYYTCSNCGKKFKDEDGTEEISKVVLPALDHDWVNVEFKAPTCEEDGHSAYKECSRCDAITGKTIYKATGHKFTGAYTFDSAIGYHSRYCVNDNCLADGEKAHGINDVKYSVEYDGLDYVIEGGEPCTFVKDSVAVTDENGIHSHKLICVCGNESSKAYIDTETFVETVAPNCTDKGYDVHKCPDCDEEWHKNFVDALDHDLSATATPNGDGTHSVKCNRDGCDYEEDAVACSTETPSTTCGSKNICDVCGGVFGEAIDHVFTDYKYNNDATCTEDGTKTAECDNCDTNATHTITATGTKLGHNMTAYGYSTEEWASKPDDFSEEIKEPTCSEEGLSISYCTRCDNYRTKVVKADTNAHVWKYDLDDTTDWDYAGGDCSIGVTLKNPCTVCGIAKTVVVTGNHDWHATYSFEPTCTQPGIRREVCYVCEAEQVITCDDDPTLAPVEHTYGEETSVPANCTEAAHKEQTCTVCGFVNKYDFDEVFGVQHAFNKGVEYEATCETIGYKEYTCSECNYVEKVKTSDALGHKDANGDKKCDECFGKMYDDSDSSKGCGCICHKDSWLMRIIYKILRFFWKLFKISKSCECGAVHW